MVARHGLKLQMVMSFHQCGGNVGDFCSLPFPPWVQEEMSRDPGIMYRDPSGRWNPEYISLGCDMIPVLRGRTPVQVYTDYMRSFRDHFQEYLGDVIEEIQVGMGRCGELRYPSYPESNGTWRFPGIGEFQCNDKYMRASLQATAIAVGHENWGLSGPQDSGHYNQFPEDTGFFIRGGTWNSEYGKFFLEWYSEKLLPHGDRILAAAEGIFRGTSAKLSGKVAGIHWHYRTRSHAAELTAEYYNTRERDGYIPIAQTLAKHGVVLNFTCMEMKDERQPGHANCSPQLLVRQVKEATKVAGVELAGENALRIYEDSAYSQALTTSRADAGSGLSAFTYLRMNKNMFPRKTHWGYTMILRTRRQNALGIYDDSAYSQALTTSRADAGSGLSAFTYLRMNKNMFEGENWIVKSMNEGGRRVMLSKSDSSHSDLYVGVITNRNQNLKAGAAV